MSFQPAVRGISLRQRVRGGSDRVIRELLDRSVDLIASVNGWPPDEGEYRIQIVKGDQAHTRTDPIQLFDTDAHPYRGENLRLEIGQGILDGSAATYLRAAGVSDQHILTLILGHETFHLGEIKRQTECRLPAVVVHSGFAKGSYPSMHPDWRAAAKALAMEYRHANREKTLIAGRQMSAQALRANDIVSEGCADLISMGIMGRIVGDPAKAATINQAVVAHRIADGAPGPKHYQHGTTLQAILKTPGDFSLPNIIVATWKEAFQQISLAPDAPIALKHMAASAPLSLVAPSPAPSPQPSQSKAQFKR